MCLMYSYGIEISEQTKKFINISYIDSYKDYKCFICKKFMAGASC